MFKSNKDVKRLLEMREKTLNNDELKALEKVVAHYNTTTVTILLLQIMAHIVKCIKIANNTVDNYIKHVSTYSTCICLLIIIRRLIIMVDSDSRCVKSRRMF